jgi:hypothetical protein
MLCGAFPFPLPLPLALALPLLLAGFLSGLGSNCEEEDKVDSSRFRRRGAMFAKHKMFGPHTAAAQVET